MAMLTLAVCMGAAQQQRARSGQLLNGCMWSHLVSVQKHKRPNGVIVLMVMLGVATGQLWESVLRILAT